jgi:hypothetical protein
MAEDKQEKGGIQKPKADTEKVKYLLQQLNQEEFARLLPLAARQKMAEQEAQIARMHDVIGQLQTAVGELKGKVNNEYEQRVDEVLRRKAAEAKTKAENTLILRPVSPIDHRSFLEIRAITFDRKRFKTIDRDTGEVAYHPFLWGIELQARQGGYNANFLLTRDPKSSTPTMRMPTTYTMSGFCEDIVNQVTAGIVTFNMFDTGMHAIDEVGSFGSESYLRRIKGELLYYQHELAGKNDEIVGLKKQLNQIAAVEEETRQALEEATMNNDMLIKSQKSSDAVAKRSINSVKKMMDDHAEIVTNAHNLGLSMAMMKQKNEVYEETIDGLNTALAEKMPASEMERVAMDAEDRTMRAMSMGVKMSRKALPSNANIPEPPEKKQPGGGGGSDAE